MNHLRNIKPALPWQVFYAKEGAMPKYKVTKCPPVMIYVNDFVRLYFDSAKIFKEEPNSWLAEC